MNEIEISDSTYLWKESEPRRKDLVSQINKRTTAPLVVHVTPQVKLKKSKAEELPPEKRVMTGALMYFFTRVPEARDKNAVLIFVSVQDDMACIIADKNSYAAIGEENLVKCKEYLEKGFAGLHIPSFSMSFVISKIGDILEERFPKNPAIA